MDLILTASVMPIVAFALLGAAWLVFAHARLGTRGLVLAALIVELVVLYRPLTDEYYFGTEGAPLPGVLMFGVPPVVAAAVVGLFAREGRRTLVGAVSAVAALLSAVPSYLAGCAVSDVLRVRGCFF